MSKFLNLPLHFNTLLPNRGFFPHCTQTHTHAHTGFYSGCEKVDKMLSYSRETALQSSL